MMAKKTVVFDFDGVIHSYASGWKGITEIPDDPVKGIREAIAKLREDYEIVIVSTRCAEVKGIMAMAKWLDAHGIVVDRISDVKPPAIVTIDDRCICFNGDAASLMEKVRNFRTYWEEQR